MNTADTWFTISNKGWARMNAGRNLGHLVREAVSNVFDADGATVCVISANSEGILVSDNAPNGIADKSLITTVFMTDKEDSYTKRGRKGRGLKELIAAAESAEVVTNRHMVRFNADGTRTETELDEETVGTVVTVRNSSWTDQDIKDCIEYLRRMMPPPTIKMVINGEQVVATRTFAEATADLETTVIQDGVQTNAVHETKVWVRDLREGEELGWIYEMGIPVQEIGTKFHVDVQQRIPMNDNRDVVDSKWLPSLFAAVLSCTIDEMTEDELTATWVNDGIDKAMSSVKRTYANKLVPVGSVIESAYDKRANDVAKQRGAKVVDISKLPYQARWAVEAYATTAVDFVKRIDKDTKIHDCEDYRTKYYKFVIFYEWLAAKVTGRYHRVTFMESPPDYTGFIRAADYNEAEGRIRYNLLSSGFNFNVPIDEYALSSTVHELAHSASSEHEEEFRDRMQEIAGKVAYVMFTCKAEIEAMLGGAEAAAMSSARNKKPINCQWDGCTEVRMVKPQDVHQVRYCVPHQKKAAANRRASIRQNGGPLV